MKAWYFLSFLFIVYSISTLIDERYEVTYLSEDLNKSSELYQQIICFSILDTLDGYSNVTEIGLNMLSNNLYDHLNKTKYKINFALRTIFEELILNPIKFREFIIYRNNICIYVKGAYHFNRFHILKKRKYFAFKNETYTFIEIKKNWLESRPIDSITQRVSLLQLY